MFTTKRVGITVSAAVAMVVSGDCVPSAPTINKHAENIGMMNLDNNLNLVDQQGEWTIDTVDRVFLNWVTFQQNACRAQTPYNLLLNLRNDAGLNAGQSPTRVVLRLNRCLCSRLAHG